MAFVHGKGSVFTVDSKELTDYLDSVELNNSVDTAETTTLGDEAKTYLNAQSDATISISGKYDSTATTGPDAVLNGLVGNDTAVTFEYGPEGDTTGDVKYSGSCFLTGYKMTSPVGDVVAFTADFQCTGAITKGTYS
jgi:hypothetical protein